MRCNTIKSIWSAVRKKSEFPKMNWRIWPMIDSIFWLFGKICSVVTMSY